MKNNEAGKIRPQLFIGFLTDHRWATSKQNFSFQATYLMTAIRW